MVINKIRDQIIELVDFSNNEFIDPDYSLNCILENLEELKEEIKLLKNFNELENVIDTFICKYQYSLDLSYSLNHIQ